MNFSELTFTFSRNESNPPKQQNKLFITARFDKKNEEPGLRYISFFMYEKELKEFAKPGFNETLTDITHRLNICGDVITFYDFELPTRYSFGEFKVPFASFEIPTFVRKLILRLAQRAWKGLKDNYSEDLKYNPVEVKLQFSNKQAEKLLSKYGQAKGSLAFNVQESISARFAKDSEHPQFRDMTERLSAIAKNSTYAIHERAKLFIFRDGEDYTWRAETPKGKQILFGGLVNHNKKDPSNPDWSLHT